MRLGLMLGYSGSHYNMPLDLVREADELGYDSVWTAEAYGSDAVTPATWVLANTKRIKAGTAIMQLAISPAVVSCWASGRRARRWWKAGTASVMASR